MNHLLFGHNPEERIVAFQQVADSAMRLYIRDGSTVRTRDEKFFPFFFLTDAAYLKGLSRKHLDQGTRRRTRVTKYILPASHLR